MNLEVKLCSIVKIPGAVSAAHDSTVSHSVQLKAVQDSYRQYRTFTEGTGQLQTV